LFTGFTGYVRKCYQEILHLLNYGVHESLRYKDGQNVRKIYTILILILNLKINTWKLFLAGCCQGCQNKSGFLPQTLKLIANPDFRQKKTFSFVTWKFHRQNIWSQYTLGMWKPNLRTPETFKYWKILHIFDNY
jgi:hypothetical protein